MEREKLELSTQAAFMIMDVFKAQITTPVLQKFAPNTIQSIKVPPNLIHIYQPFDVTMNGAAK